MVPALVPAPHADPIPSTVLRSLLSNLPLHLPRLLRGSPPTTAGHVLIKRNDNFDPHNPRDVAFAALIPILVLLSGLFAGLTLGYMSLDETQLKVLSISGTPYAYIYPELDTFPLTPTLHSQ